MQLKQKITKTAAVILSAAVVALFGTAEYYSSKLPESLTAETGSELKIASYPEIICGEAIPTGGILPASNQVTFSLFGAIPVKNVEIHESEAPVLVVGGSPFGIKLLMDGVMVTELGEVENPDGEKICPAADAGIQTGDIIRLADNTPISSNAGLQEVISSSEGEKVMLKVIHNGTERTAVISPVFSKTSNTWKGGMWVRDSIAGIGTMTFINKTTGEFAGLGHPICDSDTGELIPINTGEAVPVEITETQKGFSGIPGALHGSFSHADSYGILTRNSNTGIYGRLNNSACEKLCENAEELKLGYRQEIKTGEAYIYTSVAGKSPEKYRIEIESVDYTGSDETKNMIIRITDDKLIDSTGGIVQGMSGSPIIQNGKLIGAVTHVFISDPAKGYGIFAENMAEYLSF